LYFQRRQELSKDRQVSEVPSTKSGGRETVADRPFHIDEPTRESQSSPTGYVPCPATLPGIISRDAVAIRAARVALRWRGLFRLAATARRVDGPRRSRSGGLEAVWRSSRSRGGRPNGCRGSRRPPGC